MTQGVLFPAPVYRNCVHGIPITWTPHECQKCDTDPGDEPKGKR